MREQGSEGKEGQEAGNGGCQRRITENETKQTYLKKRVRGI